jgi:RHS repeat-associated protein
MVTENRISFSADANLWTGNWFVVLGQADGSPNPASESEWAIHSYANWWGHAGRIHSMDVDGDGLTDILIGPDSDGSMYLLKSNGSNFIDCGRVGNVSANYSPLFHFDSDSDSPVFYADVTGDGLPDIIVGPDLVGQWFVLVNQGAALSFSSPALWMVGPYGSTDPKYVQMVDFDGDGKTDVLMGPMGDGSVHWLRSTGSQFVDMNTVARNSYGGTDPNRVRAIDVNGDGLPDLLLGPNSDGSWYWMENRNGSSLVDRGVWHTSGSVPDNWDDLLTNGHVVPADIDGDGVVNMLIGPDGSGNWLYDRLLTADPNSVQPDLLSFLHNGYGATSSIVYQPTTRSSQAQLPFPIYVPQTVTVDDGNGVSATTAYQFNSGYYHTGERDFRGFGTVTVTGPAWPDGTHNVTTTSFHQGNVSQDVPSAPIGCLKGKPSRVKAFDTTSNLATQTDTIYQSIVDPTNDPANKRYCFAPPSTVTTSTLQSGVATRRAQTQFFYSTDGYGNLVEQDDFGDLAVSNDDRSTVYTYALNPASWIVGLPLHIYQYSGAGTQPPPAANLIGETDYNYDGTADCSAASSGTTPAIGNITRAVQWTNPTSSIDTWYGYDTFGNQTCIRDPNRNLTHLGYDGTTETYLRTTTNPMGFVQTTQYYGIDGVTWASSSSDPGIFGLTQSTTDPNSATTIYAYDVFGRVNAVSAPDGLITTTTFGFLGAVGSQFVQTSSVLGTSQQYFDGLGRTIKTRKQGSASGRWIDATTTYLPTGAVNQVSTPFFEASGGPSGYSSTTYDPRGRPLVVTAADGTQTKHCYNDGLGLAVTVDPNFHQTAIQVDVRGQQTRVHEYSGVAASCDASTVGTPYSTVQYEYDPLGRLKQVDLNAQTSQPVPVITEVDWLGRTYFSSDPDMGNWTYMRDNDGNIIYQIDANGKILRFDHDPIGRVRLKHYCAAGTTSACGSEPQNSSDVAYTYDDPSIQYSKGRLTKMLDSAGSTGYTYNQLGQTLSKARFFSSDVITLTGLMQYDSSRRLQKLTYPNGDTVTYGYDMDGNLSTVADATTSYATFSNYNEVGQVGTANYSDGTVQTFTYFANSYRPKTVGVASNGLSLMSLTYQYDPVGNVLAISDSVHPNLSQSFQYDDWNRLVWSQSPGYNPDYSLPPGGLTYNYDPTRAHVLKTTTDGRSYSVDPNGNTTSDTLRTIVWNSDNQPTSVTTSTGTTNLFYDGSGARIKKQTGGASLLYYDDLFDCVPAGGTCTQYVKYVFAGSRRIAAVGTGLPGTSQPYNFAADALSSTRIVTHAGAVSSAFYGAYGAILSDTTTGKNKYTGQEWDSETSLYNYRARLYDPALGRFLSADNVVHAGSAVGYNRYAYANNNPTRCADPTGHVPAMIVGAVIGAVIGGTMAAFTHHNVAQGVAMGAVTGAFMGMGSAAAQGLTGVARASVLAGYGAAAGATNAKLFGGSVAASALTGAASAFLGSAVLGSPGLQLIGCQADANACPITGLINPIINASLAGAGIGAIQAASTGGDIGDGALQGAEVWGLGAAAHDLLGHVIGVAATGHLPLYDEKNGVFIYNDASTAFARATPIFGSAVTIGNSIIAGPHALEEFTISNPSVRNAAHELSHYENQAALLGLSYIPAHLFLQGFSAIVAGGDAHAANILETDAIGVPY